MESLLYILIFGGLIALVCWIVKLIINSATNVPTWKGIVISALLGVFGFYLFLCWMGWMGEERDDTDY